MVADRDAAAAGRVVAEITEAGGTAAAFTIDVRSYDQTRARVQFAVDRYGALDFALNNAGITPALADVHAIALQACQDVIDINLTGVFHSRKAELNHMLDIGRGAILNKGLHRRGHGSRRARLLHRLEARDRRPHPIRRGRVRPSAASASTPSHPGRSTPASARALPPEVRASIAAKTAMGRVGDVEEVANVVSFLLSDEAALITGSVYEVNEGQTQL